MATAVETVITGYGVDDGFPVPGCGANPGSRDECDFPDSLGDRDTCREIPVATITETCADGHMELLRACRGHVEEVTGWGGVFIGDADSPGVPTCPQCRLGDAPHACPIRVLATWDDMRPTVVIQERLA
jgi:hypothetical protein